MSYTKNIKQPLGRQYHNLFDNSEKERACWSQKLLTFIFNITFSCF